MGTCWGNKSSRICVDDFKYTKSLCTSVLPLLPAKLGKFPFVVVEFWSLQGVVEDPATAAGSIAKNGRTIGSVLNRCQHVNMPNPVNIKGRGEFEVFLG